jgi:hypothetical protein
MEPVLMHILTVSPKTMQLARLSPHVFALCSCAIAWIRDLRACRSSRLAMMLAFFEFALLLDTATKARILLHDWVVRAAEGRNVYDERSPVQHLALFFLVVIGIGALAFVLRYFRDRPGATLAVSGAIFSASCWIMEIISLHAVDHVIYHTVYGIMFSGILRAIGVSMTGFGILWDIFGNQHGPHGISTSAFKPVDSTH